MSTEFVRNIEKQQVRFTHLHFSIRVAWNSNLLKCFLKLNFARSLATTLMTHGKFHGSLFLVSGKINNRFEWFN